MKMPLQKSIPTPTPATQAMLPTNPPSIIDKKNKKKRTSKPPTSPLFFNKLTEQRIPNCRRPIQNRVRQAHSSPFHPIRFLNPCPKPSAHDQQPFPINLYVSQPSGERANHRGTPHGTGLGRTLSISTRITFPTSPNQSRATH